MHYDLEAKRSSDLVVKSDAFQLRGTGFDLDSGRTERCNFNLNQIKAPTVPHRGSQAIGLGRNHRAGDEMISSTNVQPDD
ncbi:hypothetical protein EVAR_100334_1 [Eumeta japonica]|uniref:Uncharacterized protein n=1 Tax=Eumeta variegata TaxID=151549 RepID=A0A4C1ZME2_EUMVA|nr:hypothetical protein EVAR_100328_1 [Eumeta japonica]GBP97013.1 hypothetical protein EVAR_100334_1 [Eumeta japonica]